MTKPTLLSGIQPSGMLNIGNYIGAIRNWANLQTDHDCLFMLADLHSITVKQDPKELRERCYDFLALYIACGIEPEKNTLFCQSHAPAHTQLAWILNCYTYMGELSRMTQFKDKSQKQGENINVGLFSYPALMAADILLYNTNLVPVGHDQKQHLELARNIAQRFNNIYGDVFTIPEPYIPPVGARIMGLQDPTKKMSKSDINQNNNINLLDPPDVLIKKIKRAVTDSGTKIHNNPKKPGISNLLTIFSIVTEKNIDALEQEYLESGYGKFKQDLAEAVVEFLTPIQQRYRILREDHLALNTILKRGADSAKKRSEPILKKIHDLVGLINE